MIMTWNYFVRYKSRLTHNQKIDNTQKSIKNIFHINIRYETAFINNLHTVLFIEVDNEKNNTDPKRTTNRGKWRRRFRSGDRKRTEFSAFQQTEKPRTNSAHNSRVDSAPFIYKLAFDTMAITRAAAAIDSYTALLHIPKDFNTFDAFGPLECVV